MRMVSLVCSLVIASSVFAADSPRQIKYPLKTARTLWSDEQIAQARKNIQQYPQAKKIADGILKEADYWVAWRDEDLVQLITDSRVPRAFETGTAGCPACGKKMLESGAGQYGWIIDPKIPFKVKCPVDGTVYPSNDYAAYYRSDFKLKPGWDTKYVDDGWGWTGPNGEKYWFVAYYNHWMWHGKMVPGLRALGCAYLLSGDRKYAHAAVVMLHRIAQVYPAMDHAKQSRYGAMMAARGIDYPGKVVNAIWETGLARSVTDAYDDVWETIDSDAAAQKLFSQTGEQIRSLIEANFLEDAIDAYFSGKIRGNFGMHQDTLVHLGIVRQFGEKEKWFDDLLNRSSADRSVLGLNFALYNMISRDGMPDENSPGYNFIWVEKIAEYGDQLSRMGRDIFIQPKTRRLFDGVIDQLVIQSRTPSLGDAGTVYGGITGQSAQTYQTAYRHYKDERYAKWLAQMGASGADGFKTFESLMYPPIESSGVVGPQRSRLKDGYGQTILNNANDTVGLSMFYGLHAGHGHFDRLNIDIFAEKTPLTPDLGYPDAMNDFVKGIYTWSKNTISHNTVVVDSQRQIGNVPGVVKLFADSSFARVIDVDATGTYPQCSQYRRAVVMVDAGPDQSYFVDFFTVTGGKQHDYSLHGPPGKFEMIGGEWSAPESRTLAGKEVPLGFIYDKPAMEAKDYQRGYSSYAGSGFQHLFNVRHGKGEWVAQFEHEKNPQAHVRLRVLAQPRQEIMLCDAHVSPVRFPQIVKYLIARTKGKNASSRFVSVIEPYGDKPFIKSARLTDHGVVVEREGGQTDVVLYNPQQQPVEARDAKLKTDALFAVATTGRAQRLFFAGGTNAALGERHFDAQSITGKIIATEPVNSRVRVKVDHATPEQADKLAGRIVFFTNALKRSAHPVSAAKVEGDELTLTLADDLIVGRARIDAVGEDALATTTAMPLSPLYRGVFACTDDYQSPQLVRAVEGEKIQLQQKLAPAHPFKAGQDVWLVEVGPGDSFEAPAIFADEHPGP